MAIFITPGGGSPGGSDTQIQYNDSGTFGGSADLTWDDTAKELGVGGDINLDDGGTYTTTVQCVTPTANRTISFPDATGTVGLVAGSSGQLIYNNSGAYAAVSNSSVDGSGNITIGTRWISSLNGAASAPPVALTGTWFTGGTATTTKPSFLIEPTGTTSTAWSTSGTGLGVNAPSGFTGNLLDLQVNGIRSVRINNAGRIFGSGAPYVEIASDFTGSFIGGTDLCAAYANTDASYLRSKNGYLVGSFDFELRVSSSSAIGWSSREDVGAPNNLTLYKDAASILAQRNGANAQTLRVYNTFTSATNFERAKIEWSSNVLRIGTEKGADGGTARNMELQTDGINRLVADTIGSIQVATALTVATLPPSPLVGMIARVTDATAPAVGSTVVGGGSANALVWYNGSSWVVTGGQPTGVVTTSTAGLVPATSFSTLTYGATTNLDLSTLDGQYRTLTLGGNIILTTSNLAVGRTAVIRIICDSVIRNLTFPTGWVFVCTKPISIAASKTAILSITSFGSTDADVVAAIAVQP